ncbi:MAG: HTH-type transcriptional regulator LrpA [Methanomassiliicoccales archaeon PtaU1.Bin124]|nr:MAG: HTH-type transcriptional regulator LrpA [Methanomassiliicoccales archaeon PtaU1.Bin124]
MDETDLALGRSLMMNSRLPYSDLGESLGLTAQAVHRRVQGLMDEGIVEAFSSNISSKALGQMWVMAFGWSRAPSMDELDQKFKKDPMVAVFFAASGNFVYVHGVVRDPNEMAKFVSYVQKEAAISDIQVGIIPTPPHDPEEELTLLDLRIVKALHTDARRPLSDVAEEIGASVKTVRRRLERMEKEGLVQHTAHLNLGLAGGTITNLHLVLKDNVEREKVAFVLIKRISANVLRSYSFSNKPNLMIVTLWNRNPQEVIDLCRELEKDGSFFSVVPNFMRQVYYYDDHRTFFLDEALKAKARKAGK